MSKQLSQLKFYITVGIAVSSAMTGAYGLYEKAIRNTLDVKHELINRLEYIEQVKLDNLQVDVNNMNANIIQIMTKFDLRPINMEKYSRRKGEVYETLHTP